MYTSQNTGLTMLLISQIRTAGIGGGYAFDGMTGGNAIKHYATLIMRMTRSDSTSAWPYAIVKLPENSFVVTYKIDKIKGFHRYKGLTLKGYYVNGCFDNRFNIIAIGKELGIHDGKTFSYPNTNSNNDHNDDNMINYKARGLNEMINGSESRRLPEEAVKYMETLLEPTFLKLAKTGISEPETDIDSTMLNNIK